jgi:hypothetical protein
MNYDQRSKKGITNANRTYYALLPLLKSQSVLRAEKIEMYKTLIRPGQHREQDLGL